MTSPREPHEPSRWSPPTPSSPGVAPDVDSERPRLSPEQEQAVFRAAARRVASVVRRQPPPPRDDVAAAVAGVPIFGAFVSLKRAGRLRSCCGSMGPSAALGEALDEAAVRAAKDDPRFPPISPTELDDLDMEVWLLWGMRPVAVQRLDRIGVVEIGRHGLQIARGRSRGLLLPSVAVDHHLDAEGFLRQVCLKAGLPGDAWKDDDTTLSTFEGFAIRGKLAESLAECEAADHGRSRHQDPGPDRRPDLGQRREQAQSPGHGPSHGATPSANEDAQPPGGPSPDDVARLAEFCRDNVVAMVHGATPSYYLPDAFDGNVCGVILSARLATRSETLECSQISLRPEVPLQSSLSTCAETMAKLLASHRATPEALGRMRCGLTILWDPAMHGTLSAPELAGFDPRRRAVAVAQRNHWAVVYDREATAETLLDGAIAGGRIDPAEPGTVYSLAVASTLPRSGASNVAVPDPGEAVRPPAVAGRFYPGNAADVGRALDGMFRGDAPKERWAGAMVPHAGWIYSGRLAADVLRRVEIPSRVIVVCPKHHAGGSEWAVAPHRVWALPGRELASDPELAAALAAAVDGFTLDAEAHRREHAVEVQLPILARLAPETRAVGIAMSAGDPARLQRAADQLAAFLQTLPDRPLLVISTDMNHFADEAHTRQIDRHALDALERLDPEGLFQTVAEHRISMCGVVPAVFVLQTLRRLGSLAECRGVGYTTSAETSGDRSHVVGYAGYLFR